MPDSASVHCLHFYATELKTSLLFLRSFGDFAIALGVIAQSKDQQSKYRFLASIHLQPLYQALIARYTHLDLGLEFVDFQIRNKILGAFTNKHLLDAHSLLELKMLKKVVDAEALQSNVLFEQKRRQWLIRPLMNSNGYIHTSGNIYSSYARHFNVSEEHLLFSQTQTDPAVRKRVMIFPESRKRVKQLSQETVMQLIEGQTSLGNVPELAFFKHKPYDVSVNVNLHDSFTDLLDLIHEYDEIITADSLPAHLAQLMRKPHQIYYPKAIDREWITPYSKAHQTAKVF